MTLLWPWGLISLLAVAAAGFWSLRRPMQRIAPVSSLSLWEEALAALPASAVRAGRRVTAAWLLLLIGAAAAGVALSQPMWRSAAPARRIGVAIWPGAELGATGRQALDESAGALLGRLSPADRVRLLLPAAMGGASELLTPQQAAERIRSLRLLPVAAAELAVPAADDELQHVYRFAPATLALEDAPAAGSIAVGAHPADVTIDAVAVEKLAGPGGGVEAFVALRNHAADRARGSVIIEAAGQQGVALAFDIAAGGRQSLVARLAGVADYYLATVAGASGVGISAAVAARPAAAADVAMIGRDDPLLRRFVQVHPALRLTAEAGDADAVIAIGAAAPAGKLALVIDPPTPPPPWRAGQPLANLALADAAALADHPLLAHVDLAPVAVRRAAAWTAREAILVPQQRLLAVGDNALILAADNPPRVYVAFDLAAENTNFAITEACVIFLANVTKYLLPAAAADIRYEYVSPLTAGVAADMKPVDARAGNVDFAGPLPAPGVYRDAVGSFHAVSLVGLKSAPAPSDPVELARQVKLPSPQPQAAPVPLWPALLVVAVACWLAGWTLRTW